MKFGREIMPLRVTSTPYFEFRVFSHPKMAGVRSFQVDAELVAMNVLP
jgi:hypothetical protein